MTRPISLLICALGGEGGGVLTEWIIATAQRAGYAAQSTSIPGVAQRTGATTYYIEVFPTPIAQLGAKRPVFSLNPVPGALDALVSSELLETARQIGNGMATSERTLIISSSARSLTTMERMQLGDGRVESAQLLAMLEAHSRAYHCFDMASVAKESGTVVSAVLLGAIAGSGLLPFGRGDFEAIVNESGATSAASLRGFAKAFDRVSAPPIQPKVSVAPEAVPAEVSLDARVAAFPPSTHALLSLGYARVVEYQDVGYGQRYLARMEKVLAAERNADLTSAHEFSITCEMARWLALWMAFDDMVRVADLKSRERRWTRVREEVKAGSEDVLKVFDHFKPGVQEFAALLPISLARKLTAWDRARVLKGKSAWALPLKVGSHSVTGMLALRGLASLKWLRVRGSRFAAEQALIDQWLDGVVSNTGRAWSVGHELALCGRLIKGYGSTNERGKENLLHILEHLAPIADAHAATVAISAARVAALSDEAGSALDTALIQHGAPARPIKPQPIRFVRKPAKVSAS